MGDSRVEKPEESPRPRDFRVKGRTESSSGFEMYVDGCPVTAYRGDTIAAVLMAAGIRKFRTSRKKKAPRGIFCGIGQCQECRLTVNGIEDVLACQELAAPGLQVRTTDGNKLGPNDDSDDQD